MVPEKNIKSADDDLKIIDDEKNITPQLTKEASVAILNDKITAKKDCGKFNRCTGCKLLDL